MVETLSATELYELDNHISRADPRRLSRRAQLDSGLVALNCNTSRQLTGQRLCSSTLFNATNPLRYIGGWQLAGNNRIMLQPSNANNTRAMYHGGLVRLKHWKA